MTQKAKTDSELLAWDQYAAAAITESYKSTIANTPSGHAKEAAKRAAEIADALLDLRRQR